jgi:hypothetical protein
MRSTAIIRLWFLMTLKRQNAQRDDVRWATAWSNASSSVTAFSKQAVGKEDGGKNQKATEVMILDGKMADGSKDRNGACDHRRSCTKNHSI